MSISSSLEFFVVALKDVRHLGALEVPHLALLDLFAELGAIDADLLTQAQVVLLVGKQLHEVVLLVLNHTSALEIRKQVRYHLRTPFCLTLTLDVSILKVSKRECIHIIQLLGYSRDI